MSRSRPTQKRTRRLKILFLPSQTQVLCDQGTTILAAARNSGIYLESLCDGLGTCGKCRVRVIEGQTGPRTDSESNFLSNPEKGHGYRLACQTSVLTDTTILVDCGHFYERVAQEKAFRQAPINVNGAVKSREFELSDLRLEDIPVHDLDTLFANALGKQTMVVSEFAKRQLSSEIRDSKKSFSALVWSDREVIRITDDKKRLLLGGALDIGTTTIALYLCDLSNGKILASGAMTNPQIAFGADIVSRIALALRNPDGAIRMRLELIEAVNLLIKNLALSIGYAPEEVVDMTVVGNTVMHHIFLGLSLDGLAKAPFTPALWHSADVTTKSTGLDIYPGAYVHTLPVQAGFVGADSVAAIICEEPYLSDDYVLIMDLGTNGELVAGNRHGLLACSCATGPALEGASIESGMRAAKGAIERVWIDPFNFEPRYEVIGDTESGKETSCRPAGICGSGLIDAVAELYRAKLVEGSGVFSKTTTTSRLRNGTDGTREFLLVPAEETSVGRDIVLSQKDIRQVQLAKGALQAGSRMLMKKLGIAKFEKVLIAGAFGMHIDIDNALTIGLIPPCDREAIFFVGNAAGRGAYLALVDKDKRLEADRIARWTKHVQLATEPGFQREFIASLAFPPLPSFVG